jgi:hypothetical protein
MKIAAGRRSRAIPAMRLAKVIGSRPRCFSIGSAGASRPRCRQITERSSPKRATSTPMTGGARCFRVGEAEHGVGDRLAVDELPGRGRSGLRPASRDGTGHGWPFGVAHPSRRAPKARGLPRARRAPQDEGSGICLMLRSGPQGRVSKHGIGQGARAHPSRRRCAPPQDEGLWGSDVKKARFCGPGRVFLQDSLFLTRFLLNLQEGSQDFFWGPS